MKKLLTAFGVALSGVALAAVISLAGNVVGQNVAYANPAPAKCIKVTDGINVNNANANATVKLDDGCGIRKFVLKSYYAPNDKGGAFGSQQVRFAVTNPPAVVRTAGHVPVKLHVDMFDNSCFYQVDLVDVTDGDNDGKNPIVAVATGGNKDCRPDQTHSYSCTAIGLTPGANRTVAISTLDTPTVNATFTGADINWGDGTTSAGGKGTTHQYATDGNYVVTVVTHFTYNGRFDGVHNVSAPACSAPISYSTPAPPTPPTPETKYVHVCEISTKNILKIDEKLLGSAQYPSDKYTTDLSKCVVKHISICEISTKNVITIDEAAYGTASYPADKFTKDLSKCVPTPAVVASVTTTTPPAKLVNTGPGSMVALAGMTAIVAAAAHAFWRRRTA